MPLAIWLIGWPGVTLSVVLLCLGLARKWPRIMLAGAFMSLPFLLLYLMGTPRFQYWSPMAAVLNFAAVIALYKGRHELSGLLAVPYIFLVLLLAYMANN